MRSLSPQAYAMIAGTFVPLVVGVLTKLNAASWLKAGLNLALSTAGGVASTLAVGPDSTPWSVFVVTVALAYATSIAAHLGLWRPSGTSVKVNEATKHFGLST